MNDQGAQPENPVKKSLWPVYNTISVQVHDRPHAVHRQLSEMLQEGLDSYYGSPDVWHNVAMMAARVKHTDAELSLVEAGLRDYPDNIDLLCDALQLSHSTHYDLERAQQLWPALEKLPRETTGPYWRFWVYGAIYHAVVLFDPVKARELLDEGLKWVKRDTLMDILRSYRRVLYDSIPQEQFDTLEEVSAYQSRMAEELKDRYLLGIAMGVENGYVLAKDLARLLQEQAGSEQANRLVAKTAAKDSPELTFKNENYLEQALAYLDLAEQLYTGDRNHPIIEIYEERIRILMAQRRYGDALKLLRSLPQERLSDPSMAAMLRLAGEMTGEKTDGVPQATTADAKQISAAAGDQEVILQFVQTLFAEDGENLYQLAADNPRIGLVVKKVAARLG